MKKLILFLACFLFSFSVVYGQEESTDTVQYERVEIHALEDVAEEDFNGMWIPVMQYLRYFNDVVPITSGYENDFILINHSHIYVTLRGHLFIDLPYKFDEDAVLTAIFPGTKNEMDITLRLLDENYMLYTISIGGIVSAEFICYRSDTAKDTEIE